MPDKEIGLQANWKNPSQLVLKYARSRKEISIEMVKRLTKRIASDWKSPPELCRLSADKGLLTVEMFAMLGQDLSSAKETLRKLWEADMSPLGADAASQELSVMSLAAVWQAAQASRRARMEEDPNKIPELSQEDHAEFRDRFVRVHPDVILIDAKEPHKKFVEHLSRDFLIHGTRSGRGLT